MNFENFLINAEPDFKDRFLNDIWNFSDEDIEHTHDFIQLLLVQKKSLILSAEHFLIFHWLYSRLRQYLLS